MSIKRISLIIIALVLPFALMSCSDDSTSAIDIPDNGNDNGNGNGNGDVELVYGIQFEVDGELATFTVDMTPATEEDPEDPDAELFDPEQHTVYITGSLFGWPEPGTDADRQTMVLIEDENTELPVVTPTETGDILYKYFSTHVGEGWDGGEWPGDPNREAALVAGAEVNDLWGEQPEE